jgi:vacuolar-type H+-ATPase subunit E/Vma4
MAIEDILKALDDQAQADCDAVIGEAREHAKLIVEEAQREADDIHGGFVRQVERVASTDASKTVNAARLQAKMTVSTVKGDGVASAFNGAMSALPSLRGAGYDRLFAALAAEAFAGVSGDVSVHVAADDVALARDAAAAAGLTADVAGDLDTAGGLVVETAGGHIIRRNTLEDRLDRSRQLVQAEVAKVLF